MSTIDKRANITFSSTRSYDQVINPAPSTTTSTIVLAGESRTGQAVPGWRSAIANGLSATGPFTATNLSVSEIVPTNGRMEVTSDRRDWETYVGTNHLTAYALTSVVSAGDLSTVDNQARTKVYKSLRSGFSASTTLGELRETVHMIRHPAESLRKGVTSYVRAAKSIRDTSRTVKQFRKAISGTWLEYSFGWRPLLQDISSGFDAYRTELSGRTTIPFKSTFRTEKSSPRALWLSHDVMYATKLDIYRSIRSEISVQYVGSFNVSKSSYNRGFNFGATIPDFVPTAWELAPWSFLIDYFSNVGDVLNAYATSQLVSLRYAVKTTRVVTTTKIDSSLRATSGLVSVTGQGGSATWESKSVTRAGASVTIPSLSARVQLSPTRLLNIAALIDQRNSDFRYRR